MYEEFKSHSIWKIVHKKTAKVDIDDLFGDDMASDLFSEPTTQRGATTKAKKDSSTSTANAPSGPFRRRTTLLNKHIHSLKPRLVSLPSQKQPQFRSRIWLTMIQLAKDGEDMRKVVDLIPDLHKGGGTLPALFGEEFIREWPSRQFTLSQTF